MMHETEDDRLDQSLRDTFSDFVLPPGGHVWRGVEGRLPAALPVGPKPVPLVLLLPAVGLLGVAVGWLLPRPAPLNPAAPQPLLTALANSSRLAAQPELPVGRQLVTYNDSSAAPLISSRQVVILPRQIGRGRVAGRVYAVSQGYATAAASSSPLEPVAPPVLPVLAPETAAGQLLQETPGTQAAGVSAPLPETAATFSGTSPADILGAARKLEAARERRPEFRTPIHRLEERGGGLRRLRTAVTKQWQRVFGPRRTRLVQ